MGARVRMASDPGRAIHVGTQRAVCKYPRSTHPSEAKHNTVWVGVPPNGQVIWGASPSFGSQANLCSPIGTTLLFGFCPMFLMAHSPGTC